MEYVHTYFYANHSHCQHYHVSMPTQTRNENNASTFAYVAYILTASYSDIGQCWNWCKFEGHLGTKKKKKKFFFG